MQELMQYLHHILVSRVMSKVRLLFNLVVWNLKSDVQIYINIYIYGLLTNKNWTVSYGVT